MNLGGKSSTLLGAGINVKGGGTIGSFHGGLSVSATYNSDTGMLDVEGLAHIGALLGVKLGVDLSITVDRIYWFGREHLPFIK